jgi:hypothetical protein
MVALRPSARVGTVLLGFVVALVLAWVAVMLRQRATQSAEAQASSGMYAFGDFVLGVAVFAAVAVVPTGLALAWLRPVAWFWSVTVGTAMLWTFTGCLALVAAIAASGSTPPWLSGAHARIGIMPLSALAFGTTALFAPRLRHRWLLLATALTDAALFAGVVFVKFILPALSGR